ncbi:MAG: hypothetical protein HRU69_09010 [Flammeovirgaceae bacterium]|nr:MAG: hypothetical protein HRU69_09010 [Flammeovirgaceae bacterium]
MKIRITLLIAITFALTATAQTRKWFIEPSVRLAVDAEAYFIGPALGLGVGYYLTDRLSVSSSYQYFNRKVTHHDGYYDELNLQSMDAVLNYFPARLAEDRKGFFFGGGLAVQWRDEICFSIEHFSDSPDGIEREQRTYFTGTFNLGYEFPVTIASKTRFFAADLKAIGPYTVDYTEIFTQVMLGVRLRY